MLSRIIASIVFAACLAMVPSFAGEAAPASAPAAAAKAAEPVSATVKVVKEGDKTTVFLVTEDKAEWTVVDGKAKAADLAKLDGKDVEATGTADKDKKTFTLDAFEEDKEEGGK